MEALPDLARHSSGKRIKVFSKAQAEAEVEDRRPQRLDQRLPLRP